jgi:hypothetical protein
MRAAIFLTSLAGAAALVSIHAFAQAPTSQPQTAEPQEGGGLRDPSAFAAVGDQAARSRALFTEAAKVITSPRCMNCHPAGDRPTQGNDMHVHMPPVTRGDAGLGVPGNTCSACHTEHNFTLEERTSYRSIPGHVRWGMAPIEMAWQGKSLGQICLQLKDPQRNGGRDLARLHEHAAGDDLVAWGWRPGEGRDPAPGTQQLFGALVQAWIDTGAQCP